MWGAAASLVAVSAAAQSRWFERGAEPWFELDDPWGTPLPTFRDGATTYVLGERGERYVVSIHNPTNERLEVVLSVDGRDAVSGAIADYRRQRGYVLAPHGSLTVEGFRRSLDAVAAFRFSDVARSYSARRGTPQNVGIIGVAFYRERPRPRRPPPYARDEEAVPRARKAPREDAESPARSRRPSRDVDHLGTEFGETRHSRVHEVEFERAGSAPFRVVTLRYDDANGLRARGIDIDAWPSRDPLREGEPQAFPASRFATPPAEEKSCNSESSGCGRG